MDKRLLQLKGESGRKYPSFVHFKIVKRNSKQYYNTRVNNPKNPSYLRHFENRILLKAKQHSEAIRFII